MALTKIVKGMLASGSVTVPDNLSTTGTAETTSFLSGDGSWRYVNRLDTSKNYTMSNLTVSGAASVGGAVNSDSLVVTGSITAATIATSGAVASGGALSFRTTATVTGGVGLRVSGIRQSTGTVLVYYNTVTSEMAYGPASALVNPFNQSLNTFDRPSFLTVSANTGSFNQVNIFNYRLPTADGSANQVMTTNGAGVVTFRTLSDQLVFTTSTVRFAGITATTGTFTNLIFAGSVRLPTTDGTNNQILATNGAGQMSWVDNSSVEITDQKLYTTSSVTFNKLNVTTTGTFNKVSATTASIANIEVSGFVYANNVNAQSATIDNLDITNTLTTKTILPQVSSTYTLGDIDHTWYKIHSDNFIGTFDGNLIRTGNVLINAGYTSSGDLTLEANGGYINLRAAAYAKNILPDTDNSYNLGAISHRWKHIYLSNGTIYFDGVPFTANTGTITVAGETLVDQAVTSGSSPTFASVNATSVDLDSITAVNATITNLTVLGTMTTLNVTTENVTQENVVTQNFADGTSQTTAWTGTVADSQITSVSTSKVNGISIVGWSNQYGDLTGKPNQDLNTSSTVTFQHVRTANTLTFAGAVARMAGVRLASFVTPGTSSNILFYNTTTGETGWFPGPNQSVSTSSVVSFTGVTTTNITVRGNIVFNDATTQGTTGQTSVYARNALPSGTTGRIITISDSGSDLNAPAGNYAPAYWDPDATVWTYIGNSNSVTPI